MGYLTCKDCGGYYKLQKGESPDDFDLCQCGGKLEYKEYLDHETEAFNAQFIEKQSKLKLPPISKIIKPLGLGLVFIFGLLIKFHAFNSLKKSKIFWC